MAQNSYKSNTFKNDKSKKRVASAKFSPKISLPWLKDRRVQLSVGFFLLLISVFIFLACLSYFFTGKADQAKRIFDFWKGFDTEILVAEPPADCFDLLEELCDEYKMRLAIHNHQKGRSNYWSPDIVLECCNNRGENIGACCDDGQWVRSGLDPVECLNKLKGRIHNFHLKDVAQKGNLDSPNSVIGQGEANNAKSLQALVKLGYQGLIVIDFEHDTPDLQKDMASNIAFIEKQSQWLLSQSQE